MSQSSVLHIVSCATLPVFRISGLITSAQARGWRTCLILTPTAARWLADHIDNLSELTGFPVRSTYKLPGEPDVHPVPSAVLVAPVSSNTINKWAAGLGDTLALGLITEAIGKSIPITAIPNLNAELRAHPAFDRSITTLREAGVTVLLPGDGTDLWAASSESGAADMEVWSAALDTLDQSR